MKLAPRQKDLRIHRTSRRDPLAEAQFNLGGTPKTGWRHVRLKVVGPIGVGVAVVGVVGGVLSCGERADEVALDTERQLFTRALADHGERVLRELETVATSDAVLRKVRVNFDPEWMQIYVGSRLQSFFEH